MLVHAPAEPGRSLDRQIARRIDGRRKSGDPPLYSTEDSACDDLVERLRSHGIEAELLHESECWYCVFWASPSADGARERVASGSAVERSLAVCRAVLNLPLSGTGSRLHLRTASRGWIGEDEFPRSVERDPTGSPAGVNGEPRGATRET